MGSPGSCPSPPTVRLRAALLPVMLRPPKPSGGAMAHGHEEHQTTARDGMINLVLTLLLWLALLGVFLGFGHWLAMSRHAGEAPAAESHSEP